MNCQAYNKVPPYIKLWHSLYLLSACQNTGWHCLTPASTCSLLHKRIITKSHTIITLFIESLIQLAIGNTDLHGVLDFRLHYRVSTACSTQFRVGIYQQLPHPGQAYARDRYPTQFRVGTNQDQVSAIWVNQVLSVQSSQSHISQKLGNTRVLLSSDWVESLCKIPSSLQIYNREDNSDDVIHLTTKPICGFTRV